MKKSLRATVVFFWFSFDFWCFHGGVAILVELCQTNQTVNQKSNTEGKIKRPNKNQTPREKLNAQTKMKRPGEYPYTRKTSIDVRSAGTSTLARPMHPMFWRVCAIDRSTHMSTHVQRFTARCEYVRAACVVFGECVPNDVLTHSPNNDAPIPIIPQRSCCLVGFRAQARPRRPCHLRPPSAPAFRAQAPPLAPLSRPKA